MVNIRNSMAGQYLLPAMIALCSALLGRADEYTASGIFIVNQYWVTDQTGRRTNTFNVYVNRSSWLMSISRVDEVNHGIKVEIGSQDSKEIFSLRVNKDGTASGSVLRGYFPESHTYERYLWFSLVHRKTQIYDDHPPRLEKVFPIEGRNQWSAEVAYQKAPPFLPASARYYGLDSYHTKYAKTWSMELALFTNLIYTVSEWSRHGEMQFPKSACAIKYKGEYHHRQQGGFYKLYPSDEIQIIVTNISDKCKIRRFRPDPRPYMVFVGDLRPMAKILMDASSQLAPLSVGVSYSIKGEDWPTFEEGKERMGHPERMYQSKQSGAAKIFVVAGVLLLAGLPLLIRLLVKHRHR